MTAVSALTFRLDPDPAVTEPSDLTAPGAFTTADLTGRAALTPLL